MQQEKNHAMLSTNKGVRSRLVAWAKTAPPPPPTSDRFWTLFIQPASTNGHQAVWAITMILGFGILLLVEFSWPLLICAMFVLWLPVRSLCRMLSGKTGATDWSQEGTEQDT